MTRSSKRQLYFLSCNLKIEIYPHINSLTNHLVYFSEGIRATSIIEPAFLQSRFALKNIDLHMLYITSIYLESVSPISPLIPLIKSAEQSALSEMSSVFSRCLAMAPEPFSSFVPVLKTIS